MINWREDPGSDIQAPLTFGEGYVFSHRYENGALVFCGSYRPKGRHRSIRWFTSIEQAKEAAERHKSGAVCTCGVWDKFHQTDCPLVVENG